MCVIVRLLNVSILLFVLCMVNFLFDGDVGEASLVLKWLFYVFR